MDTYCFESAIPPYILCSYTFWWRRSVLLVPWILFIVHGLRICETRISVIYFLTTINTCANDLCSPIQNTVLHYFCSSILSMATRSLILWFRFGNTVIVRTLAIIFRANSGGRIHVNYTQTSCGITNLLQCYTRNLCRRTIYTSRVPNHPSVWFVWNIGYYY